MIILIDDSNKAALKADLDKIHVLRHEVFVEDLKSSGLRSENGREYAQYDVPRAVYMEVKAGEEIADDVPLSWFDRPNLLAKIFPHLFQFDRKPQGTERQSVV